MAGTVTVEESTFATVKKIKWTWTATAGGAADLATVKSYFGRVVALFTDPSGSSAPTDNYDITVTDPDGYDVLQGAGANRDTTNNETAVPTAYSVAFGQLTLNITNAGSGGAGVAILYVEGSHLPL